MKRQSICIIAFILLLLVSGCLILWNKPNTSSQLHWQLGGSNDELFLSPQSQSHAINTKPLKFSHAISLAAINDQRVVAIWYGGSAEGHSDVALYMAEYNSRAHHWTSAVKILDRQQVMRQEHRFIHTIGNPVILIDHQRWIVFFSSAFAGWSTASLNVIVSYDQGKHWNAARELITSAFFNISHNLKGVPLRYQNGMIALPAYRELFNSDGVSYVLSPDLSIQHASLMSHNHYSLQPVIVPLSPTHSIAFMRHAHPQEHPANHVMMTQSFDAGLSWQKAMPVTDMLNPDSAVAAVKTPYGLLLCLNPDAMHRHHLVFLLNHHRYTLASNSKRNFSYPYLIHWGAHRYIVGYSVPDGLQAFSFNDAWLRETLR
ncbi:MAG: exo-alpha-sialidase [Gammaproteobacteria bacterium]|nr:exo-alpha-sialidase [Gammaproteobacteria bacterium]